MTILNNTPVVAGVPSDGFADTAAAHTWLASAGGTGTAVLMGRTFFNAYLAGQGTEWEKLAEEQYDQLFHEAVNAVGMGVGVGVSANVIGKVLGKVGAKATTGYLNRVLLIRLGRYAARLLRPVTKD